MFKKNPDGSYGELRACCNVYHYKLKEIEGDDIQQKVQLGQNLSEVDKHAIVLERATFRELWEEDFVVRLPDDTGPLVFHE